MNALLQVKNLSVVIDDKGSALQILDNISFEIMPGEIVAFSGHSGSGKTMTARALLDLLPLNAKINAGSINFVGLKSDKSSIPIANTSGKKMAMIFQEPHAAMNPVIKTGRQIMDIVRVHENFPAHEAKKTCLRRFLDTGLTEPERIFASYPHQLSGGMAQRVMIAMALCCKPQLLIADEPTTALDATTQIQILKLLKELHKKENFAMIMISHDKRVIGQLADRILHFENGSIIKQ